MILENIARSAALVGLRQDRTLETQPQGTPRVICPGVNEIAAGVMLSELSARQRDSLGTVIPTELEMSVMMKFLGAEVTADGRIVVDEVSLYDLFRMALAL